MNYKIINSGSDGNATILENIILIDCGVSFKKLKDYYKDLKIVLLTHIHGDHFNKTTISKLALERPTLRFACGTWLVESLIECGVEKKNIDVVKFDFEYDYKIFKIKTFELFHDVPNQGYKIFINNKKIIYATDTKKINHITAKDFDLYLIEGNYENDKELHSRAVTPEYELRVKNTHLSKVQCYDFLLENMNDNSEYVFMHEHKEKFKKGEIIHE